MWTSEDMHLAVILVVILAVILDDDPGRDPRVARMPGHHLFCSPEEVEPLR